MTVYTAWYDDVLPYVNGCPPAVALQKIGEAAIVFCKASRSWRYRDLTAIDAVAAQQDYVIGTGATVGTLPANTVIAHVFQVNWDGERIDYATPAEFRTLSDTWFSDDGDPEYWTLFAEGVLSFWKIPSANTSGAIVVPEVALAPSQAATSVDDSIWERYRKEIAVGARAFIHQIPHKPYSDLKLGMELERQFVAAIGGANARAASGRGQGRLRSPTIIR